MVYGCAFIISIFVEPMFDWYIDFLELPVKILYSRHLRLLGFTIAHWFLKFTKFFFQITTKTG
jgi:hypothetical protein